MPVYDSDDDDDLYFDDEEDKKKQTKNKTKKGEPSFNQGGALEALMSPKAKKKPSALASASASASTSTSASAEVLVLPKSIAKGKKETSSNMSSKVAITLDKLGGESKHQKTSRQAPKIPNDKASVNDMWDRLGKGSNHGASQRKSKSMAAVPDLSDECGFIVDPGSPEALSSSSHKHSNSPGALGRHSRRGGRRGANEMGSSSHGQNTGPTEAQLTMSPAARRGASRRRRDMDRSSSHRQNALRSSSHGPGDRTAQSPSTPRQRNRSMGKLKGPGPAIAMEMSQSAHVTSTTETPGRRRMRRRGSGSIGPSIDMPFNSPASGSKEAVNAADFLSSSNGVGSPAAEAGKRPMRGRRPSQRGGDELRSPSDHGAPPPQRNGSMKSRGGRRRSRDPAAMNAGLGQKDDFQAVLQRSKATAAKTRASIM